MKSFTLDKLYSEDRPEGYYTVWHSDYITDDKHRLLFGFTGIIMYWSEKEGLRTLDDDIEEPEWLNSVPKECIKLILLEEVDL